MDAGAHITIRGLVQGVGFRYFVYTRASRLGLFGYVKNTIDGGVEVNVEGDRSLIEELLREVKVGPRSAQVTDMNIRWTEPEHHYTEFTIR
jgi:acylphosphatase